MSIITRRSSPIDFTGLEQREEWLAIESTVILASRLRSERDVARLEARTNAETLQNVLLERNQLRAVLIRLLRRYDAEDVGAMDRPDAGCGECTGGGGQCPMHAARKLVRE